MCLLYRFSGQHQREGGERNAIQRARNVGYNNSQLDDGGRRDEEADYVLYIA